MRVLERKKLMHTHLIFEARNSAGDWLETCFVFAGHWLEIGWRLAGGKGWRFAVDLLVKSTKVTTCWRFAGVLLDICWEFAGVGWRFASKREWVLTFIRFGAF